MFSPSYVSALPSEQLVTLQRSNKTRALHRTASFTLNVQAIRERASTKQPHGHTHPSTRFISKRWFDSNRHGRTRVSPTRTHGIHTYTRIHAKSQSNQTYTRNSRQSIRPHTPPQRIDKIVARALTRNSTPGYSIPINSPKWVFVCVCEHKFNTGERDSTDSSSYISHWLYTHTSSECVREVRVWRAPLATAAASLLPHFVHTSQPNVTKKFPYAHAHTSSPPVQFSVCLCVCAVLWTVTISFVFLIIECVSVCVSLTSSRSVEVYRYISIPTTTPSRKTHTMPIQTRARRRSSLLALRPNMHTHTRDTIKQIYFVEYMCVCSDARDVNLAYQERSSILWSGLAYYKCIFPGIIDSYQIVLETVDKDSLISWLHQRWSYTTITKRVIIVMR